MRQVQEALKDIGIPVIAGIWRATSENQNPPLQYVVYSSTTTETAFQSVPYEGGEGTGEPAENGGRDSTVLTLPEFIYSTYNSLLESGWRMDEIDCMDMPGFLKMRAWNAKQEQKKKEPRQRYIDEVWSSMKPGGL